MILPFVSVGPTVQINAVRRFAASSHLAGPPTPGDRIHTISFLGSHSTPERKPEPRWERNVGRDRLLFRR
jgi:hypothetical protein